MKKILIIIPAFLLILLTGCLKDKPNNDFSNLAYVAEITTASTNATVNAPSGGLAFFKDANLSFPTPDPAKISFTVNIASPYPPTKDIAVTMAVDAAALATYNADPASPVHYTLMPDSVFTFTGTTGTIHAGQRLDTFYVNFTPAKIDPTQSYMLPISIKTAAGVTISSNLSTIYFHIIGNPLAGKYNVNGTRYNYTGVIGYSGGPIPAGYVGTVASPSPKGASPLDPKNVVMDYANLGGNGYQYVINYDPAINADSISVTPNKTLSDAVSNFKVTLSTYNHLTKTMHIISTYNNAAGGSGNDRVIDETFVHQ